MANIIDTIFQFDKHAVNKYRKEAQHVLAYEPEMAKLSDEELKAKTPYFKELLSQGKTLNDIKYEAFAVAREAAKRTLGQFPFPVQIIGALVLNNGDVAEMKTGEGKTLTATMAVYLNALAGKGVHVVTVNEYLAQRDADWMGQIYRFLGLTVGINIREKTTREKKEAHDCDVTYTTNSELGFDYLRDNMSPTIEGRVLRGLNFAVIDEADSILIDEARTPLIISGGNKASASQYTVADRFVKSLRKEADFTIDVKEQTCNLTDSGNNKAERMFGIKNLYDPEYADLVHRIHQALKANYIMKRDVDYLVDAEGLIQIIDKNTGRVLKGREWSDGLHQAIQAKENVEIKQETITLATITYQNFFRLFKKLSGMTGTAKTEEEEFRKIYNMRVVCIPTNMPVIREDAVDYIFASKEAKLKALIKEVVERHNKGQPILIGTTSVESSEEISHLLDQVGLKHELLNAKNNAREAEIISHAGEKGQITLSTNMAGRGTDIKLGPGVKELGGLCVFGTERHESRRIDNQLRGRSGRQGDPGFSRFYCSLDDDLMVRFGQDNLKKLFSSYNDAPLESSLMTKIVTSAQKRVEGRNFDVRKSLLDYDDVLSKQREIMHKKRDDILFAKDIQALLTEMFTTCAKSLLNKSVPKDSTDGLIDATALGKIIMPRFMPEGSFNYKLYEQLTVDEATPDLAETLKEMYNIKNKNWTPELRDQVERQVTLRCIDRNWTKHIDNMSSLRNSIYLRSYAQTNPLQAYNNEGYDMFNEMLEMSAIETVLNLLNIQIRVAPASEEQKNAVATPAQPVIESKNKEDKSIIDTNKEPTVTAKEQ